MSFTPKNVIELDDKIWINMHKYTFNAKNIDKKYMHLIKTTTYLSI